MANPPEKVSNMINDLGELRFLTKQNLGFKGFYVVTTT